MKNNLVFAIIVVILLLGGYLLLKPQEQSVDTNVKNTESQDGQVENTQPVEKKQTSKRLDLSNKNLQKIPEYVFNQRDLEELDVSNNQLTGAIQAEIRNLQNLRVLDASNNQMTGVPAEVGQLHNLQILDLSNNQLTGLPYELGNLQNLRTLNISGNNYSELDLGIIMEKLPKDVSIIK